MDPNHISKLLTTAAGHLGRMLVEYELGVESSMDLPRILKPEWLSFGDTVRQLLAAKYEVPKSWAVLAFSRVPVPDVLANSDHHDAGLATDDAQFRHGVKLDYKSWSIVCNEILAEIETIKAIGGNSKLVATPEIAPSKDEQWPDINMGLNQVRWKGTCYEVTGEQTLLFDELVKAKGDYIAAGKVVSKPLRVYKTLPESLKDIIENSKKGYRLKQPT